METDNRSASTLQVLQQTADVPGMSEAGADVYVVGKWVWVEFPKRPPQAILDAIGRDGIGYRWNRKRACWQHPCGHFARRSPGDPRLKYGVRHAALDEAAAD